MAFIKKFTNKANELIKANKKRQLQNRQRAYKMNQLRLYELKVEAKIAQQEAKIAKSKKVVLDSAPKKKSSSSSFGFGNMDDDFVNPFGGALGINKKK